MQLSLNLQTGVSRFRLQLRHEWIVNRLLQYIMQFIEIGLLYKWHIRFITRAEHDVFSLEYFTLNIEWNVLFRNETSL